MLGLLGLLTLVGGSTGASGAAGSTCLITPVVRETLINQGGLRSTSAAPLRLVRGKKLLFKVFLSEPQKLPTCAGNGHAIQITGATVNVTNSGVALPGGSGIKSTPELPAPPSTYTYPTVSTYTAAPALDSTGDQKFTISGSVLAPSTITGQFDVTFSASLTYQSKGTSTGTSTAGPSPVTASATTTVEAKVNIHAPRILATPLGLPTKTFDQNFGADAITAMQNGFAGIAAMSPVQAGIGDLLTDAGGLRYTLNRSGLVDVTNFRKLAAGAYPSTDPNAKFCLRSDNFGNALSSGTLAAQLAGQLAAWNAANGPTNSTPDHTADLSFGVADGLQSLGGADACYDGIAAVGGRQAVGRAIAGPASITPAVFSMEWGHMGGLVPPVRDDDFNPSHSPYVTADRAPGDLNRVYNPLTAGFVSDNHTVMDRAGTWNGDNTVFERDDYEWLFCALGGTATTECKNAVPSPLGTTTGVAAGDTYFLAGTTDGATMAGTHLLEAHPSDAVVRAPAPDSSNYFLRQLKVSATGTQQLAVDRVNVSFVESDAGEPPVCNPPATPASCVGTGTVYAAVPAASDTNKVVFSRGLPGCGTEDCYVELYVKDKSATAHQINSVTTANILSPNLPPGGSAGLTSATFHTAAAPTASEDVAFLFDTTGSMSGTLAQARTTIKDQVLPAIKASDPSAQFAVANYRDFDFDCTPASGYPYQRNQDLTADENVVDTKIDLLTADGGCDTPEANFLGLREIVAGSDANKVNFRSGTRKNIVMVGDAPSHTPICASFAGAFDSTITANITDSSVTQLMKDNQVKVFPISIGGGLNASFAGNGTYPDCGQSIGANQGSDLASATGGTYQQISEADLAQAILRALGRRFRVVPTVKRCDSGASLSFSPTSKDVNPSTDVTFDTTFTVASSVAPGTQLQCTYAYVVNGTEQATTYTVRYYVADYNGQQTVTVNGTNGTVVDIYVKGCTGSPADIDYPVELAVPLNEGQATVAVDPATCPGGTPEATVNEPFTETNLVPANTAFPTPAQEPKVAIQSPQPKLGESTAKVLRYAYLPLNATALPAGATIQWSVKPPGATTYTNLAQSGGSVNVSPPGPSAGNLKGGWTGTRVFRATATYGGQTSYAEVTVVAINDTDGDGLSDDVETPTPTNNPCFAADAYLDPSSPSKDFDLDGVSDGDEIARGTNPCVADATIRATTITLPQPIDLSSTSSKWLLDGIFEQYRPMTDIDGSTVRLTKIAGNDVSTNDDFKNIGWSAFKQIGVATYGYQKLIAFLKLKGVGPGSTIVLEYSGKSKPTVTPAWTLVGSSSVKVVQSGG